MKLNLKRKTNKSQPNKRESALKAKEKMGVGQLWGRHEQAKKPDIFRKYQ